MATVLIVDDTLPNRIRLAQIAASLGYTTVLASNGARAMAMLEDNPHIVCVITDCEMPIMSGPELILEIRKTNDSLPILVYSAFRSIKEVGALLETGASGFLNYPITRDDLYEYLTRYLSKD